MSDEMIVVTTTLALYAAAVISPGPSFALVTRLSLSGRQRSAYGAVAGLAFASCIYAILTITGLAMILTRISCLATAIQIMGGCYLIWLGLGAWMNRSNPPATRSAVQARRSTRAMQGFRTGVLVNLSNPKGIAFFFSLYAVAIPPDTPLWVKLAILVCSFVLEIFWYGLAVALLSSPAPRAFHSRFAVAIERAIGAVLAGFGVKLLAEKL